MSGLLGIGVEHRRMTDGHNNPCACFKGFLFYPKNSKEQESTFTSLPVKNNVPCENIHLADNTKILCWLVVRFGENRVVKLSVVTQGQTGKFTKVYNSVDFGSLQRCKL